MPARRSEQLAGPRLALFEPTMQSLSACALLGRIPAAPRRRKWRQVAWPGRWSAISGAAALDGPGLASCGVNWPDLAEKERAMAQPRGLELHHTMPRVSVIIPSDNREDLLGETLESLRRQSFPHWEGIIVDDGSQDKSREVAQYYACQDRRFHAISRQGKRKGANVCRNQGLSIASGEYVIFLDSDDLLSETCLEHRVAAMENAPACGFGVFQTELFAHRVGDRKALWNVYTDTPDLHRFLSLDTVWSVTGPIWRRQVLMSLGGFDEDLLSFQDWDLNLRALIEGIKYLREPFRDHFYRNSPDNKSAISSVSCMSSEHLRSHERLFGKTLTHLRSAGLLDHEVRCRVAGLFWWLAKFWWRTGSVVDAARVWRTALALGLCNRHQYLEGRLIFGLYRFRGGGRIGSMIQWFCWPPQFYRTGSPYFQNAPLHLLKNKTKPGRGLTKASTESGGP